VAGGGDDTLIGGGATVGGKAFDVFIGGAKDDSLFGMGGNDILQGGKGADKLDGGDGIDLLDFSDANAAFSFTLLQGEPSPTTYHTAPTLADIGQDQYKNMEGVIGSAFNDTITGSLQGDVLVGGKGADNISGNGGSDTFVYQAWDESGSTGTTRDKITDFVHTGGELDKIDISQLHATSVTFAAGVLTVQDASHTMQIELTGVTSFDTAAAGGWIVW
jgi:large repetitive protein